MRKKEKGGILDNMELKNHYFLLRHGQTPYQVEEDKKETVYPPFEQDEIRMTKKGEEQIERAAHELKGKKIDIIISSDFPRTKQTAGIVSKELGVEPVFNEHLRDLRMGEFHNGPKEKYRNFFSNQLEKFTKRPIGGENWDDLKERMTDFLKDTETRYQGKNILVISHGDPLWFLAGIIKGVEGKEKFLERKYHELYPDVGDLIIL